MIEYRNKCLLQRDDLNINIIDENDRVNVYNHYLTNN